MTGRRILCAVVAIAFVAATAPAYAKPHKKKIHYQQGATVFIAHPPGCPRTRFCGCGASWDVYGKLVRSLYLSTAWFKFPRSSPSPGKVAVRRGHVFVLKRHVQGKVWMVNDYNSGGHKSRYHARSIAGYTIVDPRASRVAMN